MLIEMPKNILDYKAKVVGDFTMRQAIFGILGAVWVLWVMFMSPIEAASLKNGLSVLLGLPLFCFGFVRPYDMPLEQILIIMLYDNLILPPVRYYKTEFGVEEKPIKNPKTGKIVKPKKQTVKKLKAKDIKPSKNTEYKGIL